MPQFIKNFNLIFFTNGESERDCCPICGAELDFLSCNQMQQRLNEGWRCPSCGSRGNRIANIRFEGHEVAAATVPVKERLELTSDRAVCLNGEIRVGSLVLAAPDSGLACLLGTVTAIKEPEATDESKAVEVHVDFTGQYPSHRIADIETRFTVETGYFRSYQELGLSDLVLCPDQLLCVGEISDNEMASVLNSEEDAIRYSYRLLRCRLLQCKQRE